MASPYGLQRGAYEYQSDDGNTYQVGLSEVNGTQGDFATATVGALPGYPRGWVMRHVYGVSSTGARNKLPCSNTGHTGFLSGGSFTKNGVAFTIEGKIGEKRTNKGI